MKLLTFLIYGRKQWRGPTAFFHSCVVLLGFAGLYATMFFPRLWHYRLSDIAGDVFAQYLPIFYAPRSLWTSSLYAGFPIFADPQFQLWYPLNRVFALLSQWECFIIAAYVLASSFTYGYLYRLTHSKLAAVMGGLVYGMNGFMIFYWGYSSILHAAIWIPLLIWALDQLRDRRSGWWRAIGVVALALLLLSGHPQISMYGIALGGGYVLAFCGTAAVVRWRYSRRYVLMVVLGLGLTAIQLLPTLEFALLSVRSAMTFEAFTRYSLLLPQLLQLIFPYYQPWRVNWVLGIFGYVGVVPLLLTAVAVVAAPLRRQCWFWLGVLILCFSLALGSDLPLSQWTYQLPIYNKFQAPVRILLVANLAIAVLAGLGIARLQPLSLSATRLRQIIWGSLIVLLGGVGLIFTLPLLSPQNSPEATLGLPILLWSCGVIVLVGQHQLRGQRQRQVFLQILPLILILDLTSIAWRYPAGLDWRSKPPIAAQYREYLRPSPIVQHYKQQLLATQQRLLPMRGVMATYQGSLDDIPPYTSFFWGVPSAGGYGPLTLLRYQHLLGIDMFGVVPESVLDPTNRTLDILAIRYLLGAPLSSARLQLQERVGNTAIYVNQQVLPRTWLVPETILLPAAQVLSTIQTSRLPDGRFYEPRKMALVEDPKALFKPVALQSPDDLRSVDQRAEILKLEDTDVKIQTQTAAPAFLVLSDVFYPGWQATIDGQPTKIYQTNYVQRGVKVPAGEHVVEYRFEPMSFKLGAGISLAALSLSGYWVWRGHRQSPAEKTIV
jgi:hypothetical protein